MGDQVLLATADVETEEQLVLSFDRATGKSRWEAVVHHGNLNTKGHKISSQASSDVVSDGERLFVNFLNNGAIFTTALDLKGKQLWQRRVSDFQVHQGFGSSPVIYQNIVLVSADHRGGGKMTGLNKVTGEIVWQQDRPLVANYASPGIVNAAGKVQAVLAGCNKVESFDPLTGKKSGASTAAPNRPSSPPCAMAAACFSVAVIPSDTPSPSKPMAAARSPGKTPRRPMCRP